MKPSKLNRAAALLLVAVSCVQVQTQLPQNPGPAPEPEVPPPADNNYEAPVLQVPVLPKVTNIGLQIL
jgi:hypothetical protein